MIGETIALTLACAFTALAVALVIAVCTDGRRRIEETNDERTSHDTR